MKYPIHEYQLALFLQACAKFKVQATRRDTVILICEAIGETSGNREHFRTDIKKGTVVWFMDKLQKWANITVAKEGGANYEISGNNLDHEGRATAWGRISFAAEQLYIGASVFPVRTSFIPFLDAKNALTLEQSRLVERFFHTRYELEGVDIHNKDYVYYSKTVYAGLRREGLLGEQELSFPEETPQSNYFAYLQGYYGVS